MQVTPPRCSRLGLALVLLLAWGASIQGYPMRKANLQWVRCNPDKNSANCIEEKGPTFDLRPGETNRILPLRADLSSRLRLQNTNEIFPVSEDFSGSGSGSGSGGNSDSFLTDTEEEFRFENRASNYNFRLKRNLPYGDHDLNQEIPGEDFII